MPKLFEGLFTLFVLMYLAKSGFKIQQSWICFPIVQTVHRIISNERMLEIDIYFSFLETYVDPVIGLDQN